MKIFEKNGSFSKTAVQLWISYAMIMTAYAMHIFTGSAFDTGAAAVIWGLSTGTYLASNSKLTK